MAEAAAVVLAALGGYMASHRAPSAPSAAASSASALPGGLEKAGALSNVSYRPADPQGRIGVTFDVTSRQTVVGRPDDPQMARLVAYLVSRGAQTAGERSRAIELVSSHYGTGETPASPDIVRALTTTLKKDQNPGVRKKAADALAGFKMTPEVRAAFLDALRTDVNPGVRLVAVDALAAAAKEVPDAKTIESLREKAFDPTENGFVRAKAASALKGIEF
jgi:HEAT repeat protein